jgi:hypothetical protein
MSVRGQNKCSNPKSVAVAQRSLTEWAAAVAIERDALAMELGINNCPRTHNSKSAAQDGANRWSPLVSENARFRRHAGMFTHLYSKSSGLSQRSQVSIVGLKQATSRVLLSFAGLYARLGAM